MKIEFITNGSSAMQMDVEKETFYEEVSKKLKEEDYTSAHEVTVKTPDGEVIYKVGERSGTILINELSNNLDYPICTSEKFLTCVDPEKNSYKFYRLVPMGDQVKASWGRMGVAKGELFGEKSCFYKESMFWPKYYEKVGKGYIDRTDLYVTEDVKSKAPTTTAPVVASNTASARLYAKLKALAKGAVERAKVSVPITQAIINRVDELLEQMRTTSSVDEFNNLLMEVIAILQRPVRTGDGKGVKEILASTPGDYAKILTRESDLLDAMRGVKVTSTTSGCFEDHDIQVFEATADQKAKVIGRLSDTLKPKVKHVYRVIPKSQSKKFDEYVKKRNISPTTFKSFWHGSRNENWMSIIQSSLMLNPNAVITGKMFGYGIYFAPSSMKSWNYTSYRGTTWAHGDASCAFMGLYKVAYGRPYDVYRHSSEDYKSSVTRGGYDCLHAHEGPSLHADEVVFYDEAAICLTYIVEFE